MRKVTAAGIELAAALTLLAIWWMWSAGSNSFYFPPLREILTTFIDIWVFEHAGSDLVPSVFRLTTGFLIAVVVGIGGGFLLGLSNIARRTAGPIVEFLRAIPPPAFIPAAIVTLGIGDAMKVGIIAMACVWPILLNVVDGVAGVDRTLLETARSYGIRRRDRLRFVILPAALPQIFAGTRISLSVAIIVMVVSEMVASSNGIGFFILQSQRSFAIPEMWSGIVLLGLLGYTLNHGLTLVERRALQWHREAPSSVLARR